MGTISVRPKGYCTIELLDSNAKRPRIAERIDLRIVESVTTDGGDVVKAYRTKAQPIHWLQTLPPLIEFLESRREKELIVEHVDRVP